MQLWRWSLKRSIDSPHRLHLYRSDVNSMYTVVFRSSETCKKSWMLAPHGSWTCHPVHVWCHPADVDEKDPHRVGISVQSHQVDVTGWELAVLPGIYRFRFFVNRFFYPLDRIINKSGSILRWICWGDKSDGSMKLLGKRNYVVNFKLIIM